MKDTMKKISAGLYAYRSCTIQADKLIQEEGEMRAARDALWQVSNLAGDPVGKKTSTLKAARVLVEGIMDGTIDLSSTAEDPCAIGHE